MALSEIKQNINKLESLDTTTLIRYINELYLQERKQTNKIIGLQGKIKNYKRKILKVVTLLNKVFETEEPVKLWRKQND